jgi:Domain of unknown function (DUF4082)
MASIDFSLRKARYDSFSLLPQFLQELDASAGNNGYRMVTYAWNDQWFQLYDLINGIVSPAHDSWYAPSNTLPYIANLLGAPDLTAFPAAAQNLMVWCWPHIRAEKGVTRSLVALAALLGYKVNAIPLWSAFALPNPANLSDASNDPYLSSTSAIPLALDGVLNQEAVALRHGNGLWVLAEPLQGGETVIPLFNNQVLPTPPVGFTVFFPDRLEPYTVVAATSDSLTLDKPLSVVAGEPVPAMTEIPVFDPVIIYPASFFDLSIVVDDAITDPTDIVAAFGDKLQVLRNAVIPVRDRLRFLLSSYSATASYTATCPTGLYGPAITQTATATSLFSYADALAQAELAAQEAASALLRCTPEPPEITIIGIEPLAFTVFYSTVTCTSYCPADYYGPPSTVTTTRTSKLSQADADQLAYTAARGLADANLRCTRNIAPLLIFNPVSPSYTAVATYTAQCAYGELGRPVTSVGNGSATTSYADAEEDALATAAATANAALGCIPAVAPSVAMADFIYTIAVGVTVTEACPPGQFGTPVTVSQSYTFTSAGEFQPSYNDAVNLATASAVAKANAQLHCQFDAGPGISIAAPVTSYAAINTATVSCPTGLNFQSGNVVTATYTGVDPTSYAAAFATAGSGASSIATAALNCTPPPFNPDAILLVAKDEFGYDPVLRYDSTNLPYNSGNDFYYNGTPLGNSRSDFARFLSTDAPGLLARGISKIVLQVDWFTPLTTKSYLAPMVTPGFEARYSAGSGNAPWAVASFNPGNVQTLPAQGVYRGGTVGDGALLAAIKALNGAGFSVGINPVVHFVDTVNSALADRSTINYDLGVDLTNLPTWCTAYNAFLQHYSALFALAGVAPWVFYIGNGFRGMTNSANIPQRRVFLQQLLTSTGTLAAAWPLASITYAARNDEYGWNAALQDFPLDGLWDAPHITLGLNWAEPNGASLPALASSFFLPTNAAPATITALDNSSVELGMRFSCNVPGYVTGIGFYKGPSNTGVHTGTLWDQNGLPLTTATFTNETASGWQNVTFAAPVYVTPGLLYTVSYHTNVGFYSADGGYFTSDTTNGPLFVPASGGVFSYGASSYPVSSFNSTNYWVDVHFNAIPASSTTIPATWNSCQVGANSGEDMYYVYPNLPDSNRLLSTTDHSGKAYAIQSPIYPAIGSKNIAAYLSTNYWHYTPPPASFAAGATALPGNSYTDNYSFTGLTLVPGAGTAFLESRFNWFAPRSLGSVLRPSSNWLTALVVGGGGTAYTTTPAQFIAGNVLDVTVEIDVKPDFGGSPPTTSFPAIASMPDGTFQIEYNGGFRTIRSQFVMTGANPNYVSPGIFADDGAITRYYIRYFLSGGSWFLTEGYYRDGILLSTTYPLPFPPYLPSSTGRVYLGSRNGTLDPFSGSIYRFKLSALSNSSTAVYGGIFYFDEAYAGTRSGYAAENVPAMVTEMGIPSIEGGLVEPVLEVAPVLGGPMTLPAWLDANEAAYLTVVQGNNYHFSNLHGPYGCNFRRNYLHQLLGLTANLAALRAAGIKSGFVIAEWDVRSPSAFLALRSGHYIYPDGPLYPYRRVLNGKQALGM